MSDRATVSTQSARMFAARARARRWASARPALVATAAATLVGAGCWVALGSGALDVQRVAITGTTSLTAAEVKVVTHAAVGDAMLTVNVNGVRDSVAAIPAVADVTVRREWPNKIRVTVQERKPAVAVQRSNGWLLVDGSGVPFTTVANRPARVLPLTVAAPSAHDPATQAALAVLKSLPNSVRQRVTALLAPTPAGVQLRLTKGVTVVWGGPEDSPRKAKALAALLHGKARVYDVSTPGFVTTSGKPVVARHR